MASLGRRGWGRCHNEGGGVTNGLFVWEGECDRAPGGGGKISLFLPMTPFTLLLYNLWLAIHDDEVTDSSYWLEELKFRPERFATSDNRLAEWYTEFGKDREHWGFKNGFGSGVVCAQWATHFVFYMCQFAENGFLPLKRGTHASPRDRAARWLKKNTERGFKGDVQECVTLFTQAVGGEFFMQHKEATYVPPEHDPDEKRKAKVRERKRLSRAKLRNPPPA